MRKLLILLLFIPQILRADGNDSDTPSKVCESTPNPYSVTAEHVEGTGLGYNRGYTSLDLFLAPLTCIDEWSPYIDLRGHIFNNGRYAANAGVGVRYLDSIAWGGSVYYDYRNTRHHNYNQVGVGLEAIGSFWSVNINGYLPFGKKKSSFYDLSIGGSDDTPEFAYFEEHQIILQVPGSSELTAKREFAFKGLNASATFRVIEKGPVALDLTAGPYYYKGDSHKSAFGGQGTASLHLGKLTSFYVSGSYDNLFHRRVQGAISFSIPFGPKCFKKKRNQAQCPVPSFYDYNISHGAKRNEIIVVDKKEKVLASATAAGPEPAINPLTGQPYDVWFVDNTSSSDGTYESPFPTLLEAQTASDPSDLIYVFPGDGTDTGMDAGIVLQENQQLLGSGTAVTLPTPIGTITIPAQTNNTPIISNAGSNTVELANNNTVSGFHIGTSSIGVSGSSIANLKILSCEMDASPSSVVLNEVTGNVTISNNMFSEYTNQAVQIISTTGASNQTLSENTFAALAAAPNTFGITTNLSGSSELTINISDSTFSEHTNTSLSIFSSGSSIINPTISDNTITAPAGVGGTIAIAFGPGGTSSITSITGNTLINHEGNSLNITADGAVSFTSTISDNTVQGIAGTSTKAIALDTSNASSATWSTTISNNTCTGGFTQADIYLDPRGTSTLSSAIVSNNTTIGDIGATSPFGIQLDADDTSTVDMLLITNNESRNHTASEIAVSSRGTSTDVTTTISENELSTTSGVVTGNGIQLSANDASGFSATVTSNTITDMNNTGISIFTSDTSDGSTTISSNTLTGPTGVINTSGISFNSNDSSSLTTIISNNYLQDFSTLSISSNISDGSTASSEVSNNTIVGDTGTSQKAVSISSGGGATGSWSTIIQNNIVTGGFLQADIYLDPQGTATLTSATITGNTTIGPDDGSAPFGIQLDADEGSSITSLLIDNNCSKNHASAEIIVTARGMSMPSINTTISNNTLTSDTVTTQNLIFLNAFNNGTITGIISNNVCSGTSTSAIQTSSSNTATIDTTITGNKCTGSSSNAIQTSASNAAILDASITSNTCSNYTSSGISVNSSQTAAVMAPISNNTLTTTSITSAGITANVNDSSTMDTAITNNTVSHHETQSIGVNFFASDLICAIQDNEVSIGSTTGAAFGIITNLGGTTQSVDISDNNVITESGGIGSQYGIVCPQQSGSGTTKTVSITNNTVTDCGNAPAVSIPLTSGIVIPLISTDDIFVNCDSNTTINCGVGPDGQGGILCGRLNIGAGTPGHYCWKLSSCNSDTNFSLINDPPSGIATDLTLDASGNTGIVIPYMSSPFTVGSCP